MNAVTGFLGNLPLTSITLIAGWLILINLIAFFAMGRDKHKARTGQWRTPEATLFLLAIIGGSVGSILGMLVFHHKTRKWKFRIGMPLILIAQILLMILLYTLAEEVIFM